MYYSVRPIQDFFSSTDPRGPDCECLQLVSLTPVTLFCRSPHYACPEVIRVRWAISRCCTSVVPMPLWFFCWYVFFFSSYYQASYWLVWSVFVEGFCKHDSIGLKTENMLPCWEYHRLERWHYCIQDNT